MGSVTVKFIYQVLITDKVSGIYLLSESICYTNKYVEQLPLISDESSRMQPVIINLILQQIYDIHIGCCNKIYIKKKVKLG